MSNENITTNQTNQATVESADTNTAIKRQQREAINQRVHGYGNNQSTGWTYRPNVDIFDTDEELLLIADMPGSTAESIDVSLESGVLTIQAEVEQRTRRSADALMTEYGVGNFHRRFEIDERIDHDGVTAEYSDGTLTVHLPKDQQSRRRRIPVAA